MLETPFALKVRIRLGEVRENVAAARLAGTIAELTERDATVAAMREELAAKTADDRELALSEFIDGAVIMQSSAEDLGLVATETPHVHTVLWHGSPHPGTPCS